MERGRSSSLTVGHSMIEASDKYDLSNQRELVTLMLGDVGGEFSHYMYKLPYIVADVEDSERC